MGWVAEAGLPEGHLASLTELGVSFLECLCSQVPVGLGLGAGRGGVSFCSLALVARHPWLQFCPGISSTRFDQLSSRAPLTLGQEVEVRRPVEVEARGRGRRCSWEGRVSEGALGTWFGMYVALSDSQTNP